MILNNYGCCLCGERIDSTEKDALCLTFSSLWVNRALGGPEESMWAHFSCVKSKIEPLLTRPLDPEIFPIG